jgi:RNA polymerase rpb1, domain 2
MSKKKKVKLYRRNWDIDYIESLMTGQGFTITEMPAISLDGIKKKSLYGPRSELYGTTYGDEQEFVERCSCECGKTLGLVKKGEYCPFCNTIVKEVGDNIKFTGWISLGNEKIINPQYFKLIAKVIGVGAFNDMIAVNKKVDIDGNISLLEEGSPLIKNYTSPFIGIGVDGFRERFYEIMDYYHKKRKAKSDLIDVLKSEVRSVFTSHIPVYSTKLRQESVTEDTYYYGGIDREINSMIPITKLLDTATEIEKPHYLFRIQEKVNRMWDINFELLKGKEGTIRGQLLGGSLNYTSRNVIIPDYELHDDEVDVSYYTMLELSKETIIRYLMKSEDITINEAHTQWKYAKIRFSEKIYQIMLFIIQKEQPCIVLNRNPTLNFYSLLFMKIRHVTRNPNQYTLSVPIAILTGLNADFDGDILNMILVTLEELKYLFRKFNPIERMIVSKDNGLLNDYFSITKGQLIDLFYFLEIDSDISDFIPSEKSIGKSRMLEKVRLN